jgi:hypothetical protein
MRIVVVCLTIALIFAIGIFLRRGTPSISAQSANPALIKKAAGPNAVGTIRLAQDGDSCREVKIDNNTGRLSENGRVDCKQTTIPSNPREMTRRLEAIRDGFAGREP